MVARSESMFGCYDSYSYRLWSLANVWSTCQLPPSSTTNGKDDNELNSNNTDFYIKCPQCQKGCQSFQSLKDHMETSHTLTDLATIPENISTLSTTTTNSGTLSPTPSLIGGTGGPFACTQCTSTFTTKDQLEKHELLHSPNAQVSCKICNKTFANVYRLQRHMISHDESAVLRKFKCTQCDKAFKFKHHLKEHIRIHSGEKPFECPNCGKRFSHSGSYSSHMTSKKCLVMNLKLGRARGNNGGIPTNNSILDNKNMTTNRNLKRSNISPLNNNNNNIITTTTTTSTTNLNNHNNYLPILPKYTEAAAAAFLQSSLAAAAASPPFYLAPPTSLLNPNHSISPYTMPNLGHIFEQLQQQQQQRSPLRPPILETTNDNNNIDDYKTIKDNNNGLIKSENLSKSNSSSCGDLVMDCGDDTTTTTTTTTTTIATNQEQQEQEDTTTMVTVKNEKMEDETRSGTTITTTTNDLEAVKRILETVNAVVTKQFLQANVNKFSSESSSDCHSTSSVVHSPKSDNFNCVNCKRIFDNSNQLDEHECGEQNNELKSEGLAAKLEDALTTKSEDFQQQQQQQNGNISGNEEQDKTTNDDDDCESITTTDHVSEDGRKVRVRSLISDEQLKILKDNYQINPRPKREELEKIAETIGFPVRVVQVWFQNTRARDRREGRLIQVPYNPNPSTTISNNSNNNNNVPPPPPPPLPPIPPMRYPLVPSSKYTTLNNYMLEQPLDLSTKKLSLSNESSPISSPLSIQNHHDNNNDEVVNLSRKSTSRSPTSYIYTNPYQNSNSNTELLLRQSPSPIDFNNSNNSSRLAQILAQPAHKLSLPALGLIPMEQLMQLSATTDLPTLSQLISNRLNCLSPNSKKRIWNESAELLNDTYIQHDDDDGSSNNNNNNNGNDPANKRRKISQFALKSLGSPVLGNQEQEIEGQFSCDQCDKSFSKQSSLARHKYEHSGQRPHKCDECPKAFKHKHHLTEHKRLHSGEKPFQCVKCLKRFSHSGSYSQHMNHRYSYCKPYRE